MVKKGSDEPETPKRRGLQWSRAVSIPLRRSNQPHTGQYSSKPPCRGLRGASEGPRDPKWAHLEQLVWSRRARTSRKHRNAVVCSGFVWCRHVSDGQNRSAEGKSGLEGGAGGLKWADFPPQNLKPQKTGFDGTQMTPYTLPQGCGGAIGTPIFGSLSNRGCYEAPKYPKTAHFGPFWGFPGPRPRAHHPEPPSGGHPRGGGGPTIHNRSDLRPISMLFCLETAPTTS